MAVRARAACFGALWCSIQVLYWLLLFPGATLISKGEILALPMQGKTAIRDWRRRGQVVEVTGIVRSTAAPSRGGVGTSVRGRGTGYQAGRVTSVVDHG